MSESAPKPGPTGSTWAKERSDLRHAQAERPADRNGGSDQVTQFELN